MNQTNRRTVKPDMTEPTDIDALIAEARDSSEWARKEGATGYSSLFIRLADALESTTAELRQERERADGLAEAMTDMVDIDSEYIYRFKADVARAREVIEKVRGEVSHLEGLQILGSQSTLSRILDTYDQAGSTDG